MNGRSGVDANETKMDAYRKTRESVDDGDCSTDSDQVLQSRIIRGFTASVMANGHPEDGDESDDGEDEQ